MKYLITVLLFLYTCIGFSQNSSLVIGGGTATISGENLAGFNQYLTSIRLVSGQDLYSLTLDSLTQFNIRANEIFITDGPTDFLNWASTVDRYGKENSGFMRLNSLGSDIVTMQNTNDSDERYYVAVDAANGLSVLSALKKEIVGVGSYGSSVVLSPDYAEMKVTDSIAIKSDIRLTRDRIAITASDSLVLDIGTTTYNENLNTILSIDTDTKRLYYKTLNTGNVSYDTYSGVFGVTARTSRYAGSGTNVTNPGAGIYTFTVGSGAHVLEIDFLGTDAALSGGGTLTLNIDNSANSRDRFFVVQIIQRTSNGQVDATATATNYTQSSSGNITTIQISNLAGFGGAGYRIMLR